MLPDPRLVHVEREPAARGRAPGWRVRVPQGTVPGAARLFADAEHGTPGAALDAALAWRDVQLDPRHHVPVPAVPIALAPGVYFAPDTVRGHTYAVIKASADDADGKRHSLNRSLLKHAPEAAIRDAAEMRFRIRHGLAGFDYESADALYRDALAAYRSHVAEAAPSADPA